VVLAVVAAGLGGWRIGAGSAPAAALTSASLVTAGNHDVGSVYLYSGDSRWVYMSVDLGAGNGAVICQLIGADGGVTNLGSFRLADGYGSWGSPATGTTGPLRGARLVSATGTILATASFTRW
jgi:hypothetical protein